MKHVVSVSLGASSRDTDQVVTLLGEDVHIERRGTDGDMARAGALIGELDGKVDAIGLGGIDLYVYVGDRRYTLRDAARMAAQAGETPVVCGAGLKRSLERDVVDQLEAVVGWSGKRVLMVAAVDRYGMAEALDEAGATLLYGDFIFALGLPIPLYRLSTLRQVARVLLPVVTRVPFKWIYPTGSRQELEPSGRYAKYYDWADVIAGDWHYIKRYAPRRLEGKMVLTNTTTAKDVEMLRQRGVTTLITTTPRFEGRSLPTNLLEAALVAVSGKYPLGSEDYRALISRAGLEPNVTELQAVGVG